MAYTTNIDDNAWLARKDEVQEVNFEVASGASAFNEGDHVLSVDDVSNFVKGMSVLIPAGNEIHTVTKVDSGANTLHLKNSISRGYTLNDSNVVRGYIVHDKPSSVVCVHTNQYERNYQADFRSRKIPVQEGDLGDKIPQFKFQGSLKAEESFTVDGVITADRMILTGDTDIERNSEFNREVLFRLARMPETLLITNFGYAGTSGGNDADTKKNWSVIIKKVRITEGVIKGKDSTFTQNDSSKIMSTRVQCTRVFKDDESGIIDKIVGWFDDTF